MGEWRDSAKVPFPKIILVCPNNRLRTHISRYIKSKMEYSFVDDLKFIVVSEDYLNANGLSLAKLTVIHVTGDI